MEREMVVEMMKDIYTSAEAAEYLNISIQRLNQLVHDKKIIPVKMNKSIQLFFKEDLDKRKIVNFTTDIKLKDNVSGFKINNKFVREAILYFTIQQYFKYSDKKTQQFISNITTSDDFDFESKLENNIPLLAKLLNTTKRGFYETYVKVKSSFASLDQNVILCKKGDDIYSKLLANTADAPLYLFLKGDVTLLNEKSVCVPNQPQSSNSIEVECTALE